VGVLLQLSREVGRCEGVCVVGERESAQWPSFFSGVNSARVISCVYYGENDDAVCTYYQQIYNICMCNYQQIYNIHSIDKFTTNVGTAKVF
jgi:hypothetical protein